MASKKKAPAKKVPTKKAATKQTSARTREKAEAYRKTGAIYTESGKPGNLGRINSNWKPNDLGGWWDGRAGRRAIDQRKRAEKKAASKRANANKVARGKR
jgi:hypothetical protein